MGNALQIRSWSYTDCRSVQNYQQLVSELRNQGRIPELKNTFIEVYLIALSQCPLPARIGRNWQSTTVLSQQKNMPVYRNERKTFVGITEPMFLNYPNFRAK